MLIINEKYDGANTALPKKETQIEDEVKLINRGAQSLVTASGTVNRDLKFRKAMAKSKLNILYK